MKYFLSKSICVYNFVPVMIVITLTFEKSFFNKNEYSVNEYLPMNLSLNSFKSQ